VIGAVGGAPEIGVTGDVNVSGTVTASVITGTTTCCSSDGRLKKDIEALSGCLSKVQRLQGVSYGWRSSEFPQRQFSDRRQVGLIAQDVEQVLPEGVQTDAEGYKALEYGKLTAVLIEAVKEQQAQIESLKAQVEQLQVRR